MRALTIVFSGLFLMSAIAVSALPLKGPESVGQTVTVQQKKEKKKNEPFKPQEKGAY